MITHYCIGNITCSGVLLRSSTALHASITQLTRSDSGRYRCRLERPFLPDSYWEFEIRVTEGESPLSFVVISLRSVQSILREKCYAAQFTPHIKIMTERCQQFFDGLPWNFTQRFMVPWGQVLLTLTLWFSFSNATSRLTRKVCLVYDPIVANLKTFPSASVVLGVYC